MDKQQGLERRIAELETKLIQAEKKVVFFREESLHFQMPFKKSSVLYQSLDVEGRIIDVDNAWLDVLGYKREDVIGSYFYKFLVGQNAGTFYKNFKRFKENSEIRGAQFEMLSSEGKSVRVGVGGKISRDKKGLFQQTHCLLHDLSAKSDEAAHEKRPI